MKDTLKTKKQLIDELQVLRRSLAQRHSASAPAGALQRAALKPAAHFAPYENLPACVYVQESDYTISYANRKFREVFGNPGRKRCYELIGKRTAPCKPCATFAAFDTGRQVVREYRSPSGATFEVHALPFTDAAGKQKILAFGFEITGRKREQAQQALLQLCLEHFPDSVAVFSLQGDIIYANKAAADNLGYAREELRGKFVGELDPDEPAAAWKKHAAAVQRRGSLSFAAMHVRRDGTSFPVEGMSAHVEHEGQQYIFSHARDISKRTRAALALRESEERYRTLVDTAHDAIVTADAFGRIVSWNRGAEKIYGYAASEIIGRDFGVVMPGRARKKHTEAITEALRRGRLPAQDAPVEVPGRRKDGSEVMLEQTFSVLQANNEKYFMTIARDITDRKKNEDALRESEERYRKVFENAGEGILVAEIATMRFKYANPAICAMLGYAQRELIGRRVLDIHPRSSLKQVQAEFMALACGRRVWSADVPCRRKDRSLLYADITGTRVFFDGIACNLGFFTDVTERKRIQEQLFQSEALLRLTFEKAPVAAAVLNKKWRVLNVNGYCERLLGHTAAAITGRGLDAYLYPEDRDKGLQSLQAAPERLSKAVGAEIRYVAKDGRTVYARQLAQGVFDKRGALVFVIVLIEDITERKQYENINANIMLRLQTLYRELHEFSTTLPAEQSFARMGSMRDFNLSPMENRVASLLFSGSSNKAIAAHLHVSENTVKHHVTSIYGKCRVSSRLEFIRLIREKRIIL